MLADGDRLALRITAFTLRAVISSKTQFVIFLMWVQCLEEERLRVWLRNRVTETETRGYERGLGYARSDDEEVERVKDKSPRTRAMTRQ